MLNKPTADKYQMKRAIFHFQEPFVFNQEGFGALDPHQCLHYSCGQSLFRFTRSPLSEMLPYLEGAPG